MSEAGEENTIQNKPETNGILDKVDFKDERSLFVVGDDAQCIFGFRGSRVDLILEFNKIFPSVREIVLNQNYRSTQPILDLAEAVIGQNSWQKKKNLFTENELKTVKVKYYLARNEKDEGDYIASTVYDLYIKNPNKSGGNSVEIENLGGKEAGGELESETENGDVVFVSDNDEFSSNYGQNNLGKKEKKKDLISSMFDIYLDEGDAMNTPVGGNLWGSGNLKSYSNSYSGGYNPNSWSVPILDWGGVEKLNDIAILYRTHAQSRAIEEALLKHRIPYKLVSGTRFLDRKEIKDVIAMLRFVNSDDDKIALSRFLPLILSGVGAKTMEKIYAYLEDQNYPLPPRYQEMVLGFLSQIAEIFGKHTNLIEFTRELLTISGYFGYLKDQYPIKDELNTRMENISELYSLMLPFDQNEELDLNVKLNEFLLQVMLVSQAEANTKDKNGEELNVPKVSLMTLHQCKGLEFETIFMVGCEDGILPHQNSIWEPNGMEEEVRLAYVGVTRAKKNLHLVAADSRVQFGQVKSNPVSRIFRPFLDKFIKRV